MLKPLLPGICQINAAFHLSSTQGRRKQRGQGGLGPPNLEDLEKKPEAETDNLLIVPLPPDFWPPRCPWYIYIAFETITGLSSLGVPGVP